jgi:hypothetical protein
VTCDATDAGDLLEKELKALEGTWTVVRHEWLGKTPDEKEFYSPKELTFSKGVIQGRFAVDYDLSSK